MLFFMSCVSDRVAKISHFLFKQSVKVQHTTTLATLFIFSRDFFAIVFSHIFSKEMGIFHEIHFCPIFSSDSAIDVLT